MINKLLGTEISYFAMWPVATWFAD